MAYIDDSGKPWPSPPAVPREYTSSYERMSRNQIGDMIAERVGDYMAEHGCEDYGLAVQIILDADPKLKELYAFGA